MDGSPFTSETCHDHCPRLTTWMAYQAGNRTLASQVILLSAKNALEALRKRVLASGQSKVDAVKAAAAHLLQGSAHLLASTQPVAMDSTRSSPAGQLVKSTSWGRRLDRDEKIVKRLLDPEEWESDRRPTGLGAAPGGWRSSVWRNPGLAFRPNGDVAWE